MNYSQINWDTVANRLLNVGKSLKTMGSKKKVKDFSFERINNESKVSPKNRLSNLFCKISTPPTPAPIPVPA